MLSTNSNQGGAAQSPTRIKPSELIGNAENTGNTRKVSDMGVALDSKSSDDSFEVYLQKELDLDESEIPCFLHEMNDSALNYIARESFDKALVLL